MLPFAFTILLIAIFSFDKILYLILLLTPLSVPLSEIIPGFAFDMFLPTEPLLFGLLILFLLKLIYDRSFDRDILTHPVSIAIYFNLFWIFITSATSSMPVVSLKFFLSRLWFVAGFYFLAAKLFSHGKNIEKYVWLYAASLSIVILYTTFRHLGYGLYDKQAAHFVMTPFYNDHTSYGAVIAMYIPFFVLFAFGKTFNPKIKLVAFGVLGILLLGFVLSYARAAWLSMVVALGIFTIVKLKIRFQPIFITFVTVLVLFLVFQNRIYMAMENNSEQSSANIGQHISSATNITTDASNLERINRWSCALQMFSDRPVLGFGPGTYMFKYAPYQIKENRTIISTNSGDGGNAHSEYLGPLSESGVLGMLSFLFILGVVIYTAAHTYTRLIDMRMRALIVAALTGLVTYYFHGLLNNFLDTDKLSAPFWGFTAIIVAADIYSRKNIVEQKNPNLTSPDLI